MNIQELKKIAADFTLAPFLDNIQFSQDELNHFDTSSILSYNTTTGLFRNIQTQATFSPKDLYGTNLEIIDETSLYFVESKNSSSVSLSKFPFQERLELANTPAYIIIPRDLFESSKDKVRRLDFDSFVAWLEEEFLFVVGHEKKLFIKITSLENAKFGNWLGRHWIAEIDAKRIGSQECIYIKKLKRSPKHKLSRQYGLLNISFTSEENAIEADPALKAILSSQSADPNSIINLWTKYNKTDMDIMEALEAKAGELDIKKIESDSGNIKTWLHNEKNAIQNFKDVYDDIKDDFAVVAITTRKCKYEIDIKSLDVESGVIIWRWSNEKPHDDKGFEKIKIDFSPWKVAANRRLEALDAVSSSNIPIPRITSILNKRESISFIGPEITKVHLSDSDMKQAFGGNMPNSAQQKALKVCLETPDIALIQGPPGTGKTKIITALQNILQNTAEKKKQAVPSVLLTSFQHVAVDKAAKDVQVWGLPVFRFYGNRKDKEQTFEGLRKWQEKTKNIVENRIQEMNTDVEYNDFAKLDCSLFELNQAESQYDIQTSINAVISIARKHHFLKESEIIKLEEYKSLLKIFPYNEKFYTLLMGLRTSQVGFNDDGEERLKEFIRYCELRLDDTSFLLTSKDLNKIKSIDTQKPSPDDFQWIEVFRNERIAQMCPTSITKNNSADNSQLRNFISELKKNIEDRLKTTDLWRMHILHNYKQMVEFKSIRNAMLKYAVTYAASTQHSKSKAFIEMISSKKSEVPDNIGFDYVIIDEAARANPLDLFIPITLAKKKVILVGDHRQLPQLVNQKIKESMFEEGFNELTKEELTEWLDKSLFQSLWDYLNNERQDGIKRTVTLDTQYRMHPTLGKFVSDNFYAQNGVKLESGVTANNREHHVNRYKGRCAIWENTDQQEKRVSSSYINEEEIELIYRRVCEIVKETDESIGIIASYSMQAKKLKQKFELDEKLKSNPHISIGTVDSFQGEQFDIVFYSVVRNNTKRKYGFLEMDNRLNVALSRQKNLLVIVGNQSMYECEEAQNHVPALKNFIELTKAEEKHV